MRPPNAGKGRPKGSVNKVNADVKAMVLEALHHAGGAEYLLMQAYDNPKAFVTLVGRVLPLTINATVDVNDRVEAMRQAEERAERMRQERNARR
jgi:hypothetical protein